MFRFRSTRPGSTFQCRLDGSAWKTCTSPKKYTKLKQGDHTFRVRARKGRSVDRTPAKRRFAVDTVAPQTTLLTGPEDVSGDHTPTFTFEASEPATFRCRFDSEAFQPCTSPFASPEMADELYTFQVRATDAVGNADKTPATQTFEILTPIALTQEFAEAAAAYYFPDDAVIDVPPTCTGDVLVDCPGGVPVPPADQLSYASTRSVAEAVGQSRYDVTTTSTVTTLEPVVVSALGSDCDLTVDSAQGATPAWTARLPMNFVTDPTTGEMRIVPGQLVFSGIEATDFALTGPFACDLLATQLSLVLDILADQIAAQLASESLCAARGPDLVAPCPQG